MPRPCSVCVHGARESIDRALVAGTPHRRLAAEHGLDRGAVLRHGGHIPAALALAHDADEVTQADELLAQLKALRSKAMALLLAAERSGDFRTALLGVREARACLELLLEVEERIDRRPVVNLLVAPEWLVVRATLLEALGPYPEARQAVTARLVALNGHAGTG